MSAPLIAIGSVLQALGFFLALREAIKTRREEIPEQPPLHRQAARMVSVRIRMAMARLRRNHGQVFTDSAVGTARAGGTARAVFRVSRRNRPLEERVSALEEEVQEHREKQQDEQHALAAQVEAVDHDIGRIRTQLEEDRKRRLARSLHREELGIYIFIAGLVVSTVAALA